MLNPNGEYVQGYGTAFVMKPVDTGEVHVYCTRCGYEECKNVVVLDRDGNFVEEIKCQTESPD